MRFHVIRSIKSHPQKWAAKIAPSKRRRKSAEKKSIEINRKERKAYSGNGRVRVRKSSSL